MKEVIEDTCEMMFDLTFLLDFNSDGSDLKTLRDENGSAKTKSKRKNFTLSSFP